jgi:LPXTG-site transpeptidase (sortase) family protein
MDVPAGSKNVAWFALGPHPGQVGSAVIGGHFGINNGVKFVFYDLDKLKVGDKVYIVDDESNTLAFIVRSIKSFDRNADAVTVFTSNDGLAHLNLITCEGIWNKVNGSYPQRLVVFTDAIPGEGAVTVNTKTQAAKLKFPSTATGTAASGSVPAPLSPQATSTLSSINSSSALPQTFDQIVKSLYATPMDGLITSVLVLLILFLAYRIIKK